MQTGRITIYTDVSKITYENVLDVLRDAMKEHEVNAQRIQFLLDYEAGIQPLTRKKTVRPDINCQCVDNVANEVTEFNLGFKWGNPITFVQSGKKEKGIAKAVSLLNECYSAQNIKAKTQELGRFVEVCGVGYVYVDVNTEYEDGDSFFTIDILDPRVTFVVRSTCYVDKRVILAGTYRKDKVGNKYFTCFSKDMRYEIINAVKVENGEEKTDKWGHLARSGEENPLYKIPIIEFIRSYDRQGCFERQISEMDNLNLLISDFTNDVDQNTQLIWHTNDVEFPTVEHTSEDGKVTEEVVKPQSGQWMQTFSAKDGKTPIVEPLVANYDYTGMLNNIQARRQFILQKCNVPQRNDNSGGSTGVAMSDATGWSQAEAAAAKQELITDGCKMEELAVVLEAIKNSPDIEQDNPLTKLRKVDVKPNIKRQKTYEMSTKVNAMATMLSHGFSLEDSTEAVHFFDDPNEVVARSGEGVRKYQETIFKTNSTQNSGEGGEGEKAPNADRNMQDLSDQIGNSPVIDKSRTDK